MTVRKCVSSRLYLYKCSMYIKNIYSDSFLKCCPKSYQILSLNMLTAIDSSDTTLKSVRRTFQMPKPSDSRLKAVNYNLKIRTKIEKMSEERSTDSWAAIRFMSSKSRRGAAIGLAASNSTAHFSTSPRGGSSSSAAIGLTDTHQQRTQQQ